MNVALKGGGLVVTVDMGGDPLEVVLKPDKIRLDDNQWHTVVINRRVKEVRTISAKEGRENEIHF